MSNFRRLDYTIPRVEAKGSYSLRKQGQPNRDSKDQLQTDSVIMLYLVQALHRESGYERRLWLAKSIWDQITIMHAARQ